MTSVPNSTVIDGFSSWKHNEGNLKIGACFLKLRYDVRLFIGLARRDLSANLYELCQERLYRVFLEIKHAVIVQKRFYVEPSASERGLKSKYTV